MTLQTVFWWFAIKQLLTFYW